jgi:choline dehydrogenase-like flavoprotein
MVIDGRAVGTDFLVESAYCVVGSGMGGAAVAHTLARAGQDVLLVEAGNANGFPADRHDNVTAEMTGRPFDIPVTRSISLGGTSNLWHGNSNPLEEIDFEPRPWLGLAGWPIRRKDLDPFYGRAARMLGHEECAGLRPEALSASARRAMHAIDFDSSILQQKLMEYRKPPHLWQKKLLELAQAGQLRCLLNTCALELISNEEGNRVVGLKVGAGGKIFQIKAKRFILCAGALETPRLLLNSRARCPEGIGNDHDRVGRFLMDHPTGPFSMLRFRFPLLAPAYSTLSLPGGFRHLRVSLTLRPEHQAAAAVPNHYFMIRPCIAGQHIRADLRLSFIGTRGLRDLSVGQIAGIVGSPNLLYRILVARCRLPAIYRYGEIFFMTEQLPNSESRIRLSPKVRDRFGYPVASVHWQLDARDFTSFEAFTRLAFEKGLQSKQHRIEAVDRIEDWTKHLTSAAHHLGTARMSDSPAGGVVDAQLQVFGVNNLYVCDGSVFHTAGSANPSLTITALGIRLADHLMEQRV